MRTALRTCVSTRCLTEVSMVAEKNSVWRSAGMAAMIFLMVGRKPMSSMRSASSRTRMRTLPRLTSCRLRKSYSRPGVAISTCAPLRMDCNCDRSLRPPTTTAARTPVPAAILAKVSSIWMASSRVGLRMTARTPDVRLLRDQVDDGQDKRERLAGAGLRGGDHVASGQRRLDGQGLDGRGFGKAVLHQIALQRSREGEFRETFHF